LSRGVAGQLDEPYIQNFEILKFLKKLWSQKKFEISFENFQKMLDD
jgi:hypothetical protein